MRASLYKNSKTIRALTMATRTANTTVNGDTVDRLQGGAGDYRSTLFVIFNGTLTDGTVTWVVQDSDDGSAWGTPAAGDVLGTAPVVASTADDSVNEVGYVGTKRYARLTATMAGATSGGTYGAVAVLYGTAGWKR
jgi:hypothetical protein